MSNSTSLDRVRTCVGCRQRASKSVLLRVVAGDQGSGLQVLPDPSRRAPGRGAHLHPTLTCLGLAVRRRAFGRALRVDGAGLDAVEHYVRSQHRVGPGSPPSTTAPQQHTDQDRQEDGAAAHEHSMSTFR